MLVLIAVLGGGGRVAAHVAWCRENGVGATASAAVDAYYRWCLRSPGRTPLQDGGKESSSYDEWHDVQELSVHYGSTYKFLLVGQRQQDAQWEVLGGEASGP